MTPLDIKGIAKAIADCQVAEMNAELMRARVAGKIGKYISSILPVGEFHIHEFLDDCGLKVPSSPSESPFFFRQ